MIQRQNWEGFRFRLRLILLSFVLTIFLFTAGSLPAIATGVWQNVRDRDYLLLNPDGYVYFRKTGTIATGKMISGFPQVTAIAFCFRGKINQNQVTQLEILAPGNRLQITDRAFDLTAYQRYDSAIARDMTQEFEACVEKFQQYSQKKTYQFTE